MRNSIITDQISMDFEKAVYEAEKMNYRFVEIHSLWNKTIENLDNNELNLVDKILNKNNMKISALSTTLFMMAPLYTNINNLEEFSDEFIVFKGTYDQHIEKLRKCVEISKQLNTDYIRAFPFIREKGVNKEYKKVVNDITEKMLLPNKIAKNSGKIILIENCPHAYLPGGCNTYEVVKNINSDYIKILWDPANSLITKYFQKDNLNKCDNIIEEYNIIKEHISYCHIKDYKDYNGDLKFVPFGEGSINYKDLLKSLKKDSFNGFISLETELDYEDTKESANNYYNLLNTL